MNRIVQHIRAVVGHALVKHRRGPHWEKFRKEWLDDHPVCCGCGGFAKLEVHHIVPFHKEPARECDKTNVMTLCQAYDRHCHFNFGHGQSFANYNPFVAEHASAALTARRNKQWMALADTVAKAKQFRRA